MVKNDITLIFLGETGKPERERKKGMFFEIHWGGLSALSSQNCRIEKNNIEKQIYIDNNKKYSYEMRRIHKKNLCQSGIFLTET